MKLIIENKDNSNVTQILTVSNRGMKILLDFFAWIDVIAVKPICKDCGEKLALICVSDKCNPAPNERYSTPPQLEIHENTRSNG